MPDKTEKKQGKFRKGHSGNPLGRPRGTRNKATIAAEALFEGEIEGICRKAIEEAKRGNIQAIKLVLDRILPPKKEALIFINFPPVKTGSDILNESFEGFDLVFSRSRTPSPKKTAWFDLPRKIDLSRWKLSNQRIESGACAYLSEK